MTHFHLKYLTAFFLITLTFSLNAKEIPDKPDPGAGLVHDWHGLLNKQQHQMLEQKLQAYTDTTSNQIAVVIDTSLAGEDAFGYSNKLAEKWGIGHGQKDNGILLYFAMKEHKIRIQVGYGLEPVVTDAASKAIIENHIAPAFKQGNYYKGIDNGTSVIMKLAAGEFTAEQVSKGHKQKDKSYAAYIVPLFIIIMFAVSMFGRYKRVRRNHFGDSLSFWTLLMLMGSGGMGRRHGGAWGSFSGGSGQFGGGDFGGFGGGSFGGGGAGGDW